MLKMKSIEDTRVGDQQAIVVGLGELIWDLLPDGKQLGGATTNFAYISRLLGNTSILASRVGNDAFGREAKTRLEQMGIMTDYVQVDQKHPTGTVGVKIDDRGEAHYSMNENSAWDYLEWTEPWQELTTRADTISFGTMAQRETQARDTIIRFIEHARPDALRIFDVNLRHAFFTAEMLARSLELATIVKLNDDELARVTALLGLDERREEALAKQLIDKFNLDLVAITRGEKGSSLITREETVNHPGFKVDVSDTIGAGDAFSAALAHFYGCGAPLRAISEAANRLGSWTSTQKGATPAVGPEILKAVLGDLLGESV